MRPSRRDVRVALQQIGEYGVVAPSPQLVAVYHAVDAVFKAGDKWAKASKAYQPRPGYEPRGAAAGRKGGASKALSEKIKSAQKALRDAPKPSELREDLETIHQFLAIAKDKVGRKHYF